MSIASQFIARMYELPAGSFRSKSTKNIRIKAGDGISLLTDIYEPRGKGPFPTLLMRTPYGRRGFAMVAEIYAERGYRLLLQACRGTDGSGGTFDPLINERDDGLATLDWIKKQDWFDGRLGLNGPSYLGYAQWAICDALPEGAVISAKCTAADFEQIVFPGGAFHLQLWLSWLQTVHGLDTQLFGMTLRMMTGDVERRTEQIGMTLPLVDADKAATGKRIPFWRGWFENAIDNPDFWDKRNHQKRLSAKTPPNTFVSGWYDFMLDQHLADYQVLVAAGQKPYLTVGPWYHTDNEMQGECLRQTLSWMDHYLLEKPDVLRPDPVRIYVTGQNRWHDLDQFPPPVKTQSLHLHAGGKLSDRPARHSKPATYRYDPADPTPNVGGAIFAFVGAGPRDNAELEKRKDVITFTADPLADDLTIAGNVEVHLHVTSSLEYTDFFARLCDVDPKGVSTNICDAILRLTPARVLPEKDGVKAITIKLHATAHTFLKGHSLRLQVSSGAHPRYARNMGTNGDFGHATTLIPADQQIHHDPDHPSRLDLPVWEPEL